MLEQFMTQKGLYYCMSACLALGFVGKVYEWILYQRLLKNAENSGKSENKLIKQINKRYYKQNPKIHNTKAFIKTCFYKYRIFGIRLEGMKNWGSGMMLLCAMFGVSASMIGVYYRMGINDILYHVGTAMLVILGLQFMELQFSNQEKRKLILEMMEDYFDNFFANRSEKNLNIAINEEEKELLLGQSTQKKVGRATEEVAIAKENKKGKKSKKQNEEQVIEEIINEFLT